MFKEWKVKIFILKIGYPTWITNGHEMTPSVICCKNSRKLLVVIMRKIEGTF